MLSLPPIASFVLRGIALVFAGVTLPCAAAETAAESPQHSHQALATRIFQRMRLADADKTARLTEATAAYLDALHLILAARKAELDTLEKEAGPQGQPDNTRIVAAYEKAKAAYLPLRDAYVEKLEASLHPYLVDRVKDGLTHDAFPKLHAMYFEMVPNLTPSEKAHPRLARGGPGKRNPRHRSPRAKTVVR